MEILDNLPPDMAETVRDMAWDEMDLLQHILRFVMEKGLGHDLNVHLLDAAADQLENERMHDVRMPI